MSSRRNFLDADRNIMERNLRFVKNDLEENLNQYFGGSPGRDNNSPNFSAPPRDYKVVQPKPDDLNDISSFNEVEKRRKLFLQLGFTRHVAYDLAKRVCVSINRLEQNYIEYLDKGFSQDEILERILCDTQFPMNSPDNSRCDQFMLRKTPSPPPPPIISTNCCEQTNFHYDSRLCIDREEILPTRFRESSLNEPLEVTSFSSNSFNICHGKNSDKALSHGDHISKSSNFFMDFQPSTSKNCMERSDLMSSKNCGSAFFRINESSSTTQLRNVKKKDERTNSCRHVEVVSSSVRNPGQHSTTEAFLSFGYNSISKRKTFAEQLDRKQDQELSSFLREWQDPIIELKSNNVEKSLNKKTKLTVKEPAQSCSTKNFKEGSPLIRAIIDQNDPDGAISSKNWSILVEHLIREFRKFVFDNPGTLIQCSDAGWHSQGLVRLVSCPNELSVVYLEQTVRALKGLRKGIILDVVNVKKIPRRPRATATVLCEPSDKNKILQLIQFGNPDIPTQDWKIVSVDAPKNSFRRITVSLNEQSVRILLKKRCKIYYGFECIRLRVSRSTFEVSESSTGQGDCISSFDCQDDSWESANQSGYEEAFL